MVGLVLAATLMTQDAHAQYGPQPPNQFYYQLTTVARYNPLGLISFGQFTYRRRLFQTNSIFTRDNYFGIGVVPTVSPAFARIGAQVELQPVPFVRLWATYEFVGYFGTFQFLPSFTNADVDYSDSELDRQADMGRNYAATGSQLTLSGTLQAKVGPLAVRSVLRAVRPDYDLRDGDQVFYDIFFDMLMEDRNWTFNNDFDILYLHQDRFTVGIRYTWARSILSDDSFVGVDCATAAHRCDDVITHRIGPLFAYTHFKEYKARYNGPTFLMALNWWVKHPYRTGEDSSAAIPYILVGFSFSGDLLAPPGGDDDEDDGVPRPEPPPPEPVRAEPEPDVTAEPDLPQQDTEPDPDTEPDRDPTSPVDLGEPGDATDADDAAEGEATDEGAEPPPTPNPNTGPRPAG